MNNFSDWFSNLFSSSNYTRILTILFLVVIVAAVPLTVFLSQQQQTLKQHASFAETNPCPGVGAAADPKQSDGSSGTPAGDQWGVVSCKGTIQCNSGVSGTGSGCPQNTTDQCNINPSTSSWCYQYTDGAACLELHHGTVTNNTDGACTVACPNFQCGGPASPTPTPLPTACDSSQVQMTVSPNPVNANSSVTFGLSGTQGSLFVGDTWTGGTQCNLNGQSGFWGNLQCTSTTAGTYTWTHTWKNCAPNDCNVTSAQCSKSTQFTVGTTGGSSNPTGTITSNVKTVAVGQPITLTVTANAGSGILSKGQVFTTQLTNQTVSLPVSDTNTCGTDGSKCSTLIAGCSSTKSSPWCALGSQSSLTGTSGTFTTQFTPTAAGTYVFTPDIINTDTSICAGNPFVLYPYPDGPSQFFNYCGTQSFVSVEVTGGSTPTATITSDVKTVAVGQPITLTVAANAGGDTLKSGQVFGTVQNNQTVSLPVTDTSVCGADGSKCSTLLSGCSTTKSQPWCALGSVATLTGTSGTFTTQFTPTAAGTYVFTPDITNNDASLCSGNPFVLYPYTFGAGQFFNYCGTQSFVTVDVTGSGNGTTISTQLFFDGIGAAANGGNPTPLHPTKPLTLCFYQQIDSGSFDGSNDGDCTQATFVKTDNVTFQGATPTPPATITYGFANTAFNLGSDDSGTKTLASGNYFIYAKSPGYLRTRIANVQAITAGSPNQITIPANTSTQLIVGDATKDNKLDILDWNMIAQTCWLQTVNPTTAGPCDTADLNDNGTIGNDDLTVYFDSLQTQYGQ